MSPLHNTPEKVVEIVEQDIENARRMALTLADHWQNLPHAIVSMGIAEYQQRSGGGTNPLLYVRAGEPVPVEVKHNLLRELVIPITVQGWIVRAGIFLLLVAVSAGTYGAFLPPVQTVQQQETTNHVR